MRLGKSHTNSKAMSRLDLYGVEWVGKPQVIKQPVFISAISVKL